MITRQIVRTLAVCALALGCAELPAQTVATPVITAQPTSQSVVAGSSVSFSVTATGTAPLSYQWRKGNQDIVGATSPTYTLSNVQSGDAASYSVVVSNSAGTVTSSGATLTVTIVGTPPTITAQPSDQTVGAGTNVTLRVGVSGTAPFTYQWRKNGAAIAGATSDTLQLPGVTATSGGSYTVLVGNAFGSATSNPATLTVLDAPRIGTVPADQSVAEGDNAVFTVVATGATPLTYQWSKDGRALAGQVNATLALTAVTYTDAGSYSVLVTNSVGSVTSRAATLVVSPRASKIINMSVRTSAGTGNDKLIMGFVVAGAGAKAMLVRGIGPSLAVFQLSGVMSDPMLTLYRESVPLATNDNWGDSPAFDQIVQASAATGAFAIGARTKDAALFTAVQSGAYTAHLDARTETGIALVEIYDADIPATTRLINVSARSLVGPGAGVLIAGFVIQGNAPKTVLIRGIGPSLASFSVGNVLADPQLVLYKDSAVIAVNDDWWRGGGAQALTPVFSSVGAFPIASGTKDSALVATLQPGLYTAQVSGVDNNTGVALVEVYEVP